MHTVLPVNADPILRRAPRQGSRIRTESQLRAEKWRWESRDEVELLRHLCLTNFWFFFQWGFGARANPRGSIWIDEAIHKPWADWFQAHVEEWERWREERRQNPDVLPKRKHLAVVVHRGVGKTTLITQAGQAWLHLRNRELSTYTLSEKLELAVGIIGSIKAVWDGTDPYALWPKLYGNWSDSAPIWKAGEVVHSRRKNISRRDPSLGTCAVETSIVGAHPDVIFRDDPISYETMGTHKDWLSKVNEQTNSLMPVLQSDGLFLDIGTRYGSQDHFGTQLHPNEGQGIATMTGMESDAYTVAPEGEWHVYFMAGRDLKDQPTTPKVWPEKLLKEFKARQPVHYAAQILNDPAESETNPITRSEMEGTLISAKDVPWSALRYVIIQDIAFWDGRSRINKDETVYQVWGYPNDGQGMAYFIEGDGDPYWRDEHFSSILVALVQRYRRNGRKILGLTMDRPMAGMKGIWATNLRNRFNEVNEPCPVVYDFNRGGIKKIQRISAAVGFWKDSRVRVVKEMPKQSYKRLFEQMERIGEMQLVSDSGKKETRKDDWIDCMADAFQPPFYQPMRRPNQSNPYMVGASPLAVGGIDMGMFRKSWRDQMPRPPIR